MEFLFDSFFSRMKETGFSFSNLAGKVGAFEKYSSNARKTKRKQKNTNENKKILTKTKKY
jgi:hypothetical protein